jgi:hypothetical protein
MLNAIRLSSRAFMYIIFHITHTASEEKSATKFLSTSVYMVNGYMLILSTNNFFFVGGYSNMSL